MKGCEIRMKRLLVALPVAALLAINSISVGFASNLNWDRGECNNVQMSKVLDIIDILLRPEPSPKYRGRPAPPPSRHQPAPQPRPVPRPKPAPKPHLRPAPKPVPRPAQKPVPHHQKAGHHQPPR